MNKELCIKLRNQAIDNVCNKRKLSDGQIERTWLQDDFDIEFARLIAKECAAIAMTFHGSNGFDSYDELGPYEKGVDDAASLISSTIRHNFGV